MNTTLFESMDLIFTVDVFTSLMMFIDTFVEILFINDIHKKLKIKTQQKMLKLITYYKKNNKLNKKYFADIITIFIIHCMKIFIQENNKKLRRTKLRMRILQPVNRDDPDYAVYTLR